MKRYNPFLNGRTVPDVEAHTFSDGRTYFYGSLDDDEQEWCSDHYEVFSSFDLTDVCEHGISMDVTVLKDGAVKRLYAPDCIEKNGKYYLYLCCNDGSEWVAESEVPTRFPSARKIEGVKGIDPAVFIDDDGTAYYYWGQYSLNGAKLQEDMMVIQPDSVQTALVTQEKDFFHEGSSVRKRNGIYYLVFSDISRRGAPTCLGYATSTSPLGPFTYRGVIIDNHGSDPHNWNNHGSIAEIDGNWYVLYHRAIENTKFVRRTCIEPITFDESGLIAEVPMTSSGAAAYIPASEWMGAERFCILSGGCYLHRTSGGERLVNIAAGDTAMVRYIRFDGERQMVLEASGKGSVIAEIYDGSDVVCSVCSDITVPTTVVPIPPLFGRLAVQLIFQQSENLEIAGISWR